jgi:exopolyphosphatase/guanosine-5'-triphosphate,3'-diphosphate pyrophosphatase
MNYDTFAAIDIGSNAFRLLISYVEHDSANHIEFRKAAFIRVPVRLGEDVFNGGVIGPDKFGRVVEAMQGFAHLIKAFGAQSWRACATSAMREAKNGPALVAEIERTSGLKVEIISGREEAETIFEAGETTGLTLNGKSYLFIDVGGGSIEVSVFSDRRRAYSESFALGTVRTLSGKTRDEEMERYRQALHTIHRDYHPDAIIGSGGNINKVRKMLSKKARGKNNDTLDVADLVKLHQQLAALTYDQRIERYGLNDYRADVIVPALDIFLTAADKCKIDEVIVPTIGLADGVIHSLYVKSLKGRKEPGFRA